MASGSGFSLDNVLQMLTSRLLEPPEDGEPRNQIVFLLGAGCSRQYGLPNFKELLTYIWDDCFEPSADSLGGFQTLRDKLDWYWQTLGPVDRRRTLRRHLSLNESLCPGYHRLALLAQQGYVKAIVNMNFDDLLERELMRILRGSKVKFRISTSFRAASEPDNEYLMVYKPHGTIGEFGALKQLDSLVEMANNLIKASSLQEFDRELVHGMPPRLWSLHKDIWWTPKEIVDSAKVLVRASLNLWRALSEKKDASGPRSQMVQAIRQIVEGRRSPLWATNDLILDIANSDLFANPEEQIAAQELLTSHDVISIGYSGVDAKIAAALRSFKQGKNSRDKKLYFVNLDPPDPRILLVLAERASQNLCISGEEAAFENLMEQIQRGLERSTAPQAAKEKPKPAKPGYKGAGFQHLMTNDESVALGECLRLALSVRSAINVGDRSSVSIEEHGNDLYWHCSRLADIAGICLTSPERYLIHCAAFLHDLGYFSAYSGGHSVTGLNLLKRHGKITADLLRQRLGDEAGLKDRIVPASYKGSGRDLFVDMLLSLCQYHPAYELPPELDDFREVEVEVLRVKVGIRLHLLHALFSVAEHLVKEHPFRPSSDPVIDQEESAPPIDDPILDLYLRRRESEITFQLKRKKVEGRVATKHQAKPASPQALWLLNMAKAFVDRLAKDWKVEFICDLKLEEPKREGEDWYVFKDLLRKALNEELRRLLGQAYRRGRADVADILDEAERVLDRVLPKDGSPGPLQDVAGGLRQDLELILERIRVWVIAVRTEVRENWIQDMKAHLELADLLLRHLRERQGQKESEELSLAGDSAKKCLEYFEKNAERASVHAEVPTLEAARKVVDWVVEREGCSGDLRAHLTGLIDLLKQFGDRVKQSSVGEVISTLDLLSIYALPVEAGPAAVEPCEEQEISTEPRVPLDRAAVDEGLACLGVAPRLPHQGLLHLYLPLKRKWPGTGAPGANPMEQAFLRCYEEIIHPAWRFFARNWHDHSEPLLMARACLDLGSSAFRPEVAGGIKYILGEKVEWAKENGKETGFAFGHDECTLCTSRLLYILASAKRLFSKEDLLRLSNNAKQKSLDQSVAAILRYFRHRKPDGDAWWGLGTERDDKRGVYSPDYLAWAARAVTFCRSVDQEIQERTGRSWIADICGLAPADMEQLERQRWAQLLSVTKKNLLSEHTEEPATFTLGRVALAVLDLQKMNESVWDLVTRRSGRGQKSFVDHLEEAKKEVWKDSLAQMSRLYMLPVFLVLDKALQDEEERARSAAEIVKHCRKGIDSRIWIRKGSDAGSWGFNVKNTQAIVTALTAFWRYAFEEDNEARFRQAFETAAGQGAPKTNGSRPAGKRGPRKAPPSLPATPPPRPRRRGRVPNGATP